MDYALLLLRLVVGTLLLGHGAQKLLGWFGGNGLAGTARWLESIGLRPGRLWVWLAGLSEAAGGLLLILGLFNPLGPLLVIAAMGMAIAKVHWGKKIWVTSGGAELPLTNMAIAFALLLAGAGRYSLDGWLDSRLPSWVALPGLILALLAIGCGLQCSVTHEEVTQEELPA